MRRGFLSVVLLLVLVLTSGSAVAQTPVTLMPTQPWMLDIGKALGSDWTFIAEGPDLASAPSIDQISAIWGGASGSRVTVTASIAARPTRSESNAAWEGMNQIFDNTLRSKSDEKQSLSQEVGTLSEERCSDVRAAQYAALTNYGATTSFYRTVVLCSTSAEDAILIDFETLEIPTVALPVEIKTIIAAFPDQ